MSDVLCTSYLCDCVYYISVVQNHEMKFVLAELLSVTSEYETSFSVREESLLQCWVWGGSRPQCFALFWEFLMYMNSFELLKISN